MIRVMYGPFGRISVLELDHHLVEHAHADTHIQYWLGGGRNEARVSGKLVPFNDERAIAINSWQPHASPRFKPGERCKFLLLYLKPFWLASICARIGVPAGFSVTSFRYTEAIRHLATDLAANLERHPNLHWIEVESSLATLVEQSLLSMSASNTGHFSPRSLGELDRRVAKSILYMQTHLNVRKSIGEIARAAGLSRPQFFALFKRQLDISPTMYWNTMRMESSVEQLARSEIPVRELAQEVGFSEPSNFSRFFRMHSGVCPIRYRHAVGESLSVTPGRR